MRISKNAFTNLAASMIGFGVVIGLVFPFAVMTVGVPASAALTPGFFLFTVLAGILVGGVNILLARLLVQPRLALMARRMQEVEEGLKVAAYTGDWSRCDPDECAIPSLTSRMRCRPNWMSARSARRRSTRSGVTSAQPGLRSSETQVECSMFWPVMG